MRLYEGYSRDFVYIDDIVDGVIQATTFQKPGVHAFNMGFGKSTKVEDIVYKIAKNLGKKPRINFVPAPDGEMISNKIIFYMK